MKDSTLAPSFLFEQSEKWLSETKLETFYNGYNANIIFVKEEETL